MREGIIRCPICDKIIAVEKAGRSQGLSRKHGVCWELGYSIGGWGARRDFLPKFSGEVCDECFTGLKRRFDELATFVQAAKGSRREGVCIYREQRPQGDPVPDVQPDELQPKRLGAALLRLLPRFSR